MQRLEVTELVKERKRRFAMIDKCQTVGKISYPV
jgi:hypothetical protein